MTMVNPFLQQVAFRGFVDDGAPGAATAHAAENTDWTQEANTNFRVRFELEERDGGFENNVQVRLQYNRNGTGWNDVTDLSNVIRAVTSPHYADEDADGVDRLTTSTKTFSGGVLDENGLAGTNNQIDMAGNDHWEIEYCLQIVGADVNDADTIELRMVRDTASLEAWLQTPSITANVSSVINQTVNQVVEADTAQPIAKAKVKATGQVVETDNVQPITSVTAVPVGQVAETDLAQPLFAAKVKAIGQVVETDLAQPISYDGGGGGTLPTITSLGEGSGANITTLDISVTVADDVDDALVAFVPFAEGSGATSTIQSVVLDPGGVDEQAFTFKDAHSADLGVYMRAEVWQLLNPPTGTFTVRITASESIARLFGEISQAVGVNQTDPFGTATAKNSGSGSAVSATLTTSEANSLLLGCSYFNGGDSDLTPGTDVVELMDRVQTGTNGWAGYKEAPTAGSNTIDYSSDLSDDWVIIGVELLAVSQAGITQPVNQVVETDTAQPVAWAPKHRLVEQTVEADTPQPVASLKTKALNQAAEADAAQPIAAAKTKAVGQIAETNTAQAVASAKVKAIAQVVEADTAQPVASTKTKAVGQAGEIDTAQTVAIAKAKAIGQIAETDTAQPITAAGAITVAVGQVVEADTAKSVSSTKVKAIGQAAEVDLAQPVASLKAVLLAQVAEADAAGAVSSLKTATVAGVLETDLAQPITVQTSGGEITVSVGQVVETDLAQPLRRLKTNGVGQVTEVDLAQLVGIEKTATITQVTEFDDAVSIAWAPKHRLIGQVLETNTALAITLQPTVIPAKLILSEALVYDVVLSDGPIYSLELVDRLLTDIDLDEEGGENA